MPVGSCLETRRYEVLCQFILQGLALHLFIPVANMMGSAVASTAVSRTDSYS